LHLDVGARLMKKRVRGLWVSLSTGGFQGKTTKGARKRLVERLKAQRGGKVLSRK